MSPELKKEPGIYDSVRDESPTKEIISSQSTHKVAQIMQSTASDRYSNKNCPLICLGEVIFFANNIVVSVKVPDRINLDLIMSDEEIVEVNLIKQLVISYTNVVKKNLIDLTIKAIITFLINQVYAIVPPFIISYNKTR